MEPGGTFDSLARAIFFASAFRTWGPMRKITIEEKWHQQSQEALNEAEQLPHGPDSVDQYVARVRKTIETSDMDSYLTVVKNPNGALLLDVRDENELISGHVPGR
jgi:hypothetical protein